MANMIKTEASYTSLSEILEQMGGLLGSLVPIFLIGFSLLSAKWNKNSSIKEKLDIQFSKYLSGSLVADDKTDK